MFDVRCFLSFGEQRYRDSPLVTFPFNAYLLAFAGAFATTLLTLPLWKRWCARTGLVDDPGHRKIHDQPIPLAGGLAVMTGLALPTAIAALTLLLHHALRSTPVLATIPASGTALPLFDNTTQALLGYGLDKRSLELAAILCGAVGMLLVGLLDDKFELSPAIKFGSQVIVAAIVVAGGARITLFVHSAVFSYAVTILWILTVINAFNFMDNMNGLCGGLGAIGALYFATLAAADVQYLVTILALLTAGALLGFLPHNFPRARAFLGDSGSHLVGYLLAVLAILPHYYTSKHRHVAAVFLPLLVLAVPLGDMVWVVLLRWRMGKPFYIGDNNHLSHRLTRRGLSRTATVLVIWLLAALFGALALVDWTEILVKAT